MVILCASSERSYGLLPPTVMSNEADLVFLLRPRLEPVLVIVSLCPLVFERDKHDSASDPLRPLILGFPFGLLEPPNIFWAISNFEG